MTNRLAKDDSGWRSLGTVVRDTGLSTSIVYGKRRNQLSQPLKELLQRGFVEQRFFQRERGRGGEVMKVRIAYDRDSIKDYVDRKIRAGKSSKMTISNSEIISSNVYNLDHKSQSVPISTTINAEELDRKRIAVLPFFNISADPDDEYFADGMTEELIDRLCQISDLQVIARTSVMTFKKTRKKAAQIARELNVGSLIEGSVRKAENKIRVTAQLVEGKTEEHLWSSSYDRNFDNIFSIQSDIALQIVDSLKIKLLSDEKKKIEKKGTSDFQAYVAYLNGIYFNHKYTDIDMRKAIKYFENAIELDENYAEALAGLATCYIHLGYYGLEPSNQAYSKAKDLVMRAIALQPTVAEAYRAKARISYYYDWDWAAWKSEIERALQLKPSFVDAMINYAWFLLMIPRDNDRAIAEAFKAIDIDPLSVNAHNSAGHILALSGHSREALQQFDKALEFDPNSPAVHLDFGWSLLKYLGIRREEGFGEVKKAVELSGGNIFYRAVLADGYAVMGMRDEAYNMIAELEENRSKEFTGGSYIIASIYADLGEKTKALDYLERAYNEHAIVLNPLVNIEPSFADLRDEPRFKSLMKKLNLDDDTLRILSESRSYN